MFHEQLRQLAERKDSEHPFLTLYFDTRHTDGTQRDRLRVLLKDEMKHLRESLSGNGHDDQVDRGVRQIEQYFETTLDPSARGVAIFACPGEDFFLPLELPVSVESHMTIASRPHLRPLAVLQRMHPQALVAMVDGKSARLFQLAFGKALLEFDLANDEVPRKHDQGGWSQANIQRHVQDHIDRHHREVAEHLARIVDRDRISCIILSGQERNVANFREFLPKHVQEKIAGTLHLDIQSSPDEIASASTEVLDRHRTERLGQQLAVLEEVARKNGRGALGIEAVVNAVNQRKLDHLFLRRDTECRGWKCTSCHIIGRSVPLGCPACGSTVLTVDLIDHFIAAAHSESGAVDFVEGPSLLDQYEGTGALLRF